MYCQEQLHPNNKILNVGAGNSTLSEQMYEDGFRNITNIDISTVVVEVRTTINVMNVMARTNHPLTQLFLPPLLFRSK
jgi:2-polyprenyl-3-methyl-5-hydroxy-6-metoxy-1,4-benzoquinol methylase